MILPALVAPLLLAMLITGCGVFDDEPARDESGALIEAGEVEAFGLQLGDCFNDPGSPSVETVMVVPCDDPHDFEVYFTFDLPDGPFPGTDVVEELWIARCLPEFENFVGLAFDESVLDISAIFPTEQTWDGLHDREVLCSVTAVDGQPRRGSARGARI